MMRITDVTLERVGGTIPGTVGNAARSWQARAGIWLRLRDDLGHEGFGEASPLPDYSPDGIEEADAALRRVDWAILERTSDIAELAGQLDTILSADAPSARFAVETAWLDLLGKRRAQPAWALLGAEAGRRIPLSCLVTSAETTEAVGEAKAAIERGVTALKVKIGRPGRFESEMDLVRTLRQELGTTWTLRLDANGSLHPATAGERLLRLAAFDVELVEEPVALEHLSGLELPVPVALDESLAAPGTWDRLAPWLETGACIAVVLKPTLLGGFTACIRHAHRARELGMDVLVSHTFEGPVALAAAAHLALAVASVGRASGLAPHPALAAFPARTIAVLQTSHVVAHPAVGLGIGAP